MDRYMNGWIESIIIGFFSLVVPVQVATTAVAMNTDHPEWTLPITVDYLFESPQGKKSCNSFIFLS